MMRNSSGFRKDCKKGPTFHIPLWTPVAPTNKERLQAKLYSLKSFFSIRNKALVGTVVSLMLLSFGLGMFAVMNGHKTEASNEVVTEVTPEVKVEDSEEDLETFANTSINQLKSFNYVQAGPDQEIAKQARLKKYLIEKNSPFAEDAGAIETVLSLPHMKLILAISYAESTMGKKCYYNNCSGIGGYPPNLRKYKEFKNWMVDLNDLLERKYKDWTLNEMCGVYVQPCNPNWLKATRQILDELEQFQI